MSKTDIDVIIPTYNMERFIGSAIESVFSQTYLPKRLIIIDDGSTDSTRRVIKKLRSDDMEIINHVQKNKGLAAARNQGIRLSKSNYLAFLDADDVWERTKLEEQLKVFNSQKSDLGLVYCDYSWINEDGTSLSDDRSTHIDPAVRGLVFPEILRGNLISGSGSAVLIRRDCFDKTGLFDEKLAAGEDWDMWIRIALHFPVGFTEKQLVRLRWHDTNMSRSEEKLCLASTLIYNKYIREIRHHPQVIRAFRRKIFQLFLQEKGKGSGEFSAKIMQTMSPELKSSVFGNRWEILKAASGAFFDEGSRLLWLPLKRRIFPVPNRHL